MSNDKKKAPKECFTVSVNDVPLVDVQELDQSVSIALGLHKMSNKPHKVVITNFEGTEIIVLSRF